MEHDRYTYRVRVDVDPATAETRVRAALTDEGFGVLTEIDVQATLRAKLEEDTAAYTILGAYNPALAHQALQVDPALGALLPCNVVVRAHPEGGTELIAVAPDRLLGLAEVPALEDLAHEVAERFQRALGQVAA